MWASEGQKVHRGALPLKKMYVCALCGVQLILELVNAYKSVFAFEAFAYMQKAYVLNLEGWKHINSVPKIISNTKFSIFVNFYHKIIV